jgi:outer membrane lipoprotein-sorting protein
MQYLRIMAVWALGLLAAPAPQADPQVVEWLDRLEARGKEISTLQANVEYVKEDELLGDQQVRTGRVLYESGQGRQTRFAVLFKELLVDEKVVKQQQEFLFDGAWLVEKDHKHKRFVKRQVVAPGKQAPVDPLSIDGPFPLPLGQKRQSVLERFNVTLAEDPAEELPNTVHLQLTPRADAPPQPDHRKFDRIDLWFDKTTLLPAKVQTRDGPSLTTVLLDGIKVNQTDPAELSSILNMTPPGDGWKIEIKPLE